MIGDLIFWGLQTVFWGGLAIYGLSRVVGYHVIIRKP